MCCLWCMLNVATAQSPHFDFTPSHFLKPKLPDSLLPSADPTVADYRRRLFMPKPGDRDSTDFLLVDSLWFVRYKHTGESTARLFDLDSFLVWRKTQIQQSIYDSLLYAYDVSKAFQPSDIVDLLKQAATISIPHGVSVWTGAIWTDLFAGYPDQCFWQSWG